MSDYNAAYNEGWEPAMGYVERMIEEITLETQSTDVVAGRHTCWNAGLSMAGWNLALLVLRRRLAQGGNEPQHPDAM